ncbi:hypothetical protein SYK_06790 [Pseudodesulfovibrio nedwellii]|uniref:Type II toxin-antitoxin system RelE/ParE family toxin n=1 Tax=Pseudodesulfovibrio nedwellii TaxID=2973072 RepID=A0ABM8AXV3_9BACT|nr:type II toxin-antitoxin system RelE/ParE family toxin [Pseudodesulfovibrio nedwellii]BDQ35914.1 hypothetical protein SYK_02740 [Pseudodesulfovibrio nedwellii]BDQ36319.1 hypothetical protein SYK_06790 [Pseudodesulfovibrio nedwellii]
MSLNERKVFWVGSSLKDLKELGKDVSIEMGAALSEVQNGRSPENVVSFKEGGSGVMEIRVSIDKETYRTMYVAKLKKGIYVLHAFHKKSSKGKATPPKDVAKIKARYTEALDSDKR